MVPVASYVKQRTASDDASQARHPHDYTASVEFRSFKATSIGPSGKAAYARLLADVRKASLLDEDDLDVAAVLEWLLGGEGMPPADRYIRERDATVGRFRHDGGEVEKRFRFLFDDHNDALYRAGAELCLQNGGDPEQLVWWHNGEYPEPWGDAAQACMEDAAHIVHSFLSSGDIVLVDAGRYRRLLAIEASGGRE